MPGVDGSPHRGMSQRLRHHLAASVFVALWRSSEVCMLRRIGTGWMDGSFSIPAGALESGETIRMAAVREAHEEVGVRINPHDLVYVHTLHSLTAGNDWVGHFFTARVWAGTPRICEPARHSDIAWYPAACLPEPTIPYVRQALLCIDAGSIYSEFGWSD